MQLCFYLPPPCFPAQSRLSVLLDSVGKPRDHNLAFGVGENLRGGSNDESGLHEKDRAGQLPTKSVNRLMSLQDFVSLELLTVSHSTIIVGVSDEGRALTGH